MKDVYLYKSVQINKVYFIAAIILVTCFITACAGNHGGNQSTISAEELEQYRDNQQKWLSGLQEGMSPEEALRPVLLYQHYFFQYKANGKLFQYMQGQYPITGMLFGLFFEDGQLTSLLLDQAVTDFSTCRINLNKQQRVTWHLSGFQTTAAWIRLQSRLGDEFNDVSSAYLQNANDSGTTGAFEDVVIGLTYIPVIAVALPVYLFASPFLSEDKIAEGPDQYHLQSYGRPEQLREVANQIELGVATDIELIRLLGAPYYKGDTIWLYKSPKIHFGIVGGTVSWSESWSWSYLNMYSPKGVPLNSVTTVQSDYRCVPSN
jgi:hypothetical protein